jgi:hypothetical protein
MTPDPTEIRIELDWTEWTTKQMKVFAERTGHHPAEVLEEENDERRHELLQNPDVLAGFYWVARHSADPSYTWEEAEDEARPKHVFAAIIDAAKDAGNEAAEDKAPAKNARPQKARAGRA